MKSIFLFSCCFFISLFCRSQAVITLTAHTKNIKTDFGAVGDGVTDDTWAFIKAGRYFSNLWDVSGVPRPSGVNFDPSLYYGELLIPSGTYKVGRQLSVPCTGLDTTYGGVFGVSNNTPIFMDSNRTYLLGLDLIRLTGVNQMVIKKIGDTIPIIKYRDSLVLGMFDCNQVPQTIPDTSKTYDGRYGISIGSFIMAENCKNILIEDLEVDGNNTQFIYGGGYTAGLIQSGAYGVGLVNTQNITIRNLNIHHMSLDGILLDDFYKSTAVYPSQALTNFKMENTICNYNRRQGFSWVGGRHIRVNKCTFNHTSRSVSGAGSGNPGAGLDIEPEKDPWVDTTYAQLYCIDGIFDSSEFVNNQGLGLANDNANEYHGIFSYDITFNNCIFHGTTAPGAMLKGHKYTFNDCRIWGGFQYGNAGNEPGNETIFNRCDFADEEHPSAPGVAPALSELISSDGYTRRMRFSDCTFRLLHTNKRFMVLVVRPSTTEADFDVFSNCTFSTAASSGQGAGYDRLIGVTFDRNNSFVNLSSIKQQMFTNGLIFTGGTDACNPYRFSIKGNIMLGYAYSNGPYTAIQIGRNGIGTSATDGYADFVIDNEALFYPYVDVVINNGSNSRFINKNGGNLGLATGAFNNSGKVILEAGSYNTVFNSTYAFNTAATSSTVHPELYFHKNALTTVNPAWWVEVGGSTSFLAATRNANTKFDGGNTSVPSGEETSLNESLDFDGVNDYVSVPATTKIINFAASNAFSVEVTFKFDSHGLVTSLFPLVSQYTAWSIGISRNEIYYKLGGVYTSTGVTVPSGCTHLVMTRIEDDNKIRIYLDKTLVYTSPSAYIGSVSVSKDLEIGREVMSVTNRTYGYFDGWISQVRLWSRGLTEQDICKNYSWKAPLSTTDLVADWDMTDGSGTTLTDAVATAANGTLTNGPVWVTQNSVGDCVDASGKDNSPENNRTAPTVIPQLFSYADKMGGLSIFPNPSKGRFILATDLLSAGNATIEIFDVNGNIVHRQQFGVSKDKLRKEIIFTGAKGVYLLKLKNSGKVLTSKLVML